MTDKIIYKVSPRHLRPPTRWLRTTFQTSCPLLFFLIPLLWVKVDYSLIDENVINFFTYNFVHIIQFPGASSTASTSHLSLQMILRIFQEFVKISHYQSFLVVQCFKTCLPMQGMWIQSLVRSLRSHMPCSQNQVSKQKQYHKKFNKGFKMVSPKSRNKNTALS